jgi:hypothetical protein
MELNFNEISDNNINNINNINNNYNNYWNNSNQKLKKNKITYDDILSSLNLVVNENGVLQYMTPKNNIDTVEHQKNIPHQFPQSLQKEETIKISKVEPQLKNSAIYNKYFKNYKEEPSQAEEVKPLTISEYNRMVLQNRIRKIQEQKRISQIKSKKMLFTSETNQVIKYTSPYNLNRLFKY